MPRSPHPVISRSSGSRSSSRDLLADVLQLHSLLRSAMLRWPPWDVNGELILSLLGELAGKWRSVEDDVPTMMPPLSVLRPGMRRLPLRGADLVLMARHPRWKGIGQSHNTLLVVECDGPIASERVSRALDRFLDVCPWPAARLRRSFPWGKFHWWAEGARTALIRPPVRRGAAPPRGKRNGEDTSGIPAPTFFLFRLFLLKKKKKNGLHRRERKLTRRDH